MEEEGSLPVLLSGHKAMGNLIDGKRIRSVSDGLIPYWNGDQNVCLLAAASSSDPK